MKIEWRQVTWYSKVVALGLFIILPFVGFYLGKRYEKGTLFQVPGVVNTPIDQKPAATKSGTTSGTKQPAGAPKSTPSGNQPFLHVLSPNGGETICIGKPFTFRWEGRGLSSIKIGAQPSPGAYFPIGGGTFSGGSTQIVWTVNLPEGGAYTLTAEGVASVSSKTYSDTSDRLFQVSRCQ